MSLYFKLNSIKQQQSTRDTWRVHRCSGPWGVTCHTPHRDPPSILCVCLCVLWCVHVPRTLPEHSQNTHSTLPAHSPAHSPEHSQNTPRTLPEHSQNIHIIPLPECTHPTHTRAPLRSHTHPTASPLPQNSRCIHFPKALHSFFDVNENPRRMQKLTQKILKKIKI